MLPQAFGAMLSGRPGPVNLDVPLNVFAEPAPSGVSPAVGWSPAAVRRGARGRGGGAGPAARARSARSSWWVRGPRTALCRPGNPGPPDNPGSPGDLAADVAAFAADAGIPVLSSPAGKDLAAGELYLGPTGRNGTLQANRAARHADVILALGTRFDDRSTSSWLPGYTYAIPPARLIHVHGDPAEIGRNYPATLGISAHVATVVGQLRRELLARRSAGAPGRRARPGAPPGAGAGPLAVVGAGVGRGVGAARRAGPRRGRRAAASGPGARRTARGPARRRHPAVRRGRASQLDRPGVAARRAGHATAELGIRGDGVRRRRACSARGSRHRPARSRRWSATAGS